MFPVIRCAQRLAASTKLSLFDEATINRRPCACAQRLAASTKLSQEADDESSLIQVLCSTPCGINEVVTEWVVDPYTRQPMCSTPCGINEVVTSISFRSIPRWIGAQRLAASTKLSLSAELDPDQTKCPCSTPCGINEVVTTAPRAAHPQNVPVLNALRHQRSCHLKLGWMLKASEKSAQRLAASTKLSHRLPRAARVPAAVVLNALRHQRSCHPLDYDERYEKLVVLNALRHQRSCHKSNSQSQATT